MSEIEKELDSLNRIAWLTMLAIAGDRQALKDAFEKLYGEK